MKPKYHPAALQADNEASNQTFPWGIIEQGDKSYRLLKKEVFETYLDAETRVYELNREAYRAYLRSVM